MDKQQFLKGVHLLENNFGEQPEGKIEVMFSVMENDFDNKTYELTVNYLIKNWKPPFYKGFPVIADFYDYKRLMIKVKAEKLVAYIRNNWWMSDINKTLDLKDGALHATIRMYGRKNLQYDDFWKYNTKDFINSYIAKVQNGDYDNRPLRGAVDLPETITDHYSQKLDETLSMELLNEK
jgi:hypothetical protein